MKGCPLGETLDGQDLLPLGLHGQHQVGVYGPSPP